MRSAAAASPAQFSVPAASPALPISSSRLLGRQVGQRSELAALLVRSSSSGGIRSPSRPAARSALTSAVPVTESVQLRESTRIPPNWWVRTCVEERGGRVGAVEADEQHLVGERLRRHLPEALGDRRGEVERRARRVAGRLLVVASADG